MKNFGYKLLLEFKQFLSSPNRLTKKKMFILGIMMALIALFTIGQRFNSNLWPGSGTTQLTSSGAKVQQDVETRVLTLPSGIDVTQVWVPTGIFIMGDEEGEEDEKPAHEVYLDGFWLDQTEVTNVAFAAFLNDRGNQEEAGITWLEVDDEDALIQENEQGKFVAKDIFEEHPVIEVSWYGAVAYCHWAGGYLPTEAQWEKAARGELGVTWPWGNEFNGNNLNWYVGQYLTPKGYTETAKVGSYRWGASPYGAFDMAGNVWEWVADWYANDYYQISPYENPLGPIGSDRERKVLRGGSSVGFDVHVRTFTRDWSFPTTRNQYIGLRCAGY